MKNNYSIAERNHIVEEHSTALTGSSAKTAR